ncbi:nuclear protein 1 isoform X1 [Tachyglossus aculeatus]|uniref:nuclear protein 1 isoform X1 n=1 Tax=Tachyglossus aculeatus TaxID=9261 RepID=UPI0018F6C12C|nr:nuclear protein 1 isoform X1 [Tachyglossus aculeatus]
MMGVEAGGKSGDKFPCQDIGVCSRLGQGPITSELEWGCKRGRRRKRRRKRRRRLTPIRSGRTKKRSQKTEPHRHVNGNLGRQIGPQDSWTGRFSGGKNSEALMATDPLPASPRQPPASVEREEEDYLALDELYNLVLAGATIPGPRQRRHRTTRSWGPRPFVDGDPSPPGNPFDAAVKGGGR